MFTINGITWKVKYVPKRSNLLMRSDGTRTIGVTMLDSQTIYIADGLKPTLERKVLTHEICHASMFSYGVLLSSAEEEYICDYVATYGEEIINITDSIVNYIYSVS